MKNVIQKLGITEEKIKKINIKYPDRIPVIITTPPKSLFYKKNNDFTLTKHKYIAPNDCTVSQFIYFVRKYEKLESTVAIFLLIDGKYLISGNTLITDVYNEYGDNKGYIHAIITKENTFG
jgi:hypothetical protein